MAHIHIKRDHNLTLERARGKVDEMATTLSSEFKLSHEWDGDILRFKRTGTVGAIAVRDSNVEVKIKLAAALAPVKRKIEKEILGKIEELAAEE